MKRKYEVRWHEYNLTEEKRRKFFTKLGAIFFASYIEAYEYAKPELHECGTDSD